MPYDSTRDECLFTKAWETDSGRLSVSVHSYNQGPKKLQLARENRSNEGELRFAKLGRLTKEEIESLLPLIQEAISHLG
ncbi:hypothetical protein ACFL1I_03070 [Candidatus Omnitrophota bacterium]